MSELLCEVSGAVATVILNRPDRRNALSGALLSQVRAGLAELDGRADVRAIVLTGADPAFCAGLDLTELGRPDSPLSAATAGPVVPAMGKPLIGAINGAAITGGLELALACDFLVASERARFADTHARIGIMPGWGLTYELPEAIGLRRAREMSATGNFVGARTAMDWGLVNHVVPHAELSASRGSSPRTRRPAIRSRSGLSSRPTGRAPWSPVPRRGKWRPAHMRAGTPPASTASRSPAAATPSSSAAAPRSAIPASPAAPRCA